MEVQGGYKTQTVTEISNVISAYSAKALTTRALRVYLASVVSVATREASARCAELSTQRKSKAVPRYTIKELSKLTGLTPSKVKKELRVLERVGVLTFSEEKLVINRSPIEGSEELLSAIAGARSVDRPVPLPRRFIRYLCQRTKGSEIMVALLYCVRGLTITRTGEIKAVGSVKATWIADVIGASERSVRSVRADLIRINWITKDTDSRQTKLNRTGSYFVINLGWDVYGSKPGPAKGRVVVATVPVDEVQSSSEVKEVEVVAVPSSNFAPPPLKIRRILHPYVKTRKLFTDLKTRKADFWVES